MRSHTRLGTYILTALVLSALTFMAGCGGSDSNLVFQNVSERAAWGSQNRVAFTSWGANELRYIYSLAEAGGGLTLLTWSDNDDDWADEGGKHPAYSPDGQLIAMSARRGANEGIYTMDAATGDRTNLVLVTKPANEGADMMPSWSPDAQTIVFATTQDTGDMQLATVAADGTGRAILLSEPGVDLLWPVYTRDGTMILYERRVQGEDHSDIYCFRHGVPGAAPEPVLVSDFDDGSPAAGPGQMPGGPPVILFHSNRNGAKYDLWAMDFDAANLPLATNVRPVTQTSRSDGYPMWSPDGTHVGFVRDRELWTMVWTDVEDDRDYRRLTRRYR